MPVKACIRLNNDSSVILANRVTNLENTIYEYEVFKVLASGTTGSVTIPEGASILLNVYPNAGDCLLSKADAYDRPVDDPPVTPVGTPVTCTLDAFGSWSLSGVPSSYPVCIIYQVSILGKDAHNIPVSTVLDGNVVSGLHSPTAPNQFTIGAITNLQSVLDDKIEGVVGGADITVDNTNPLNPVINYSGTSIESVVAGSGVTIVTTDPKNPIISASGGTVLSQAEVDSFWPVVHEYIVGDGETPETITFDDEMPAGDYIIDIQTKAQSHAGSGTLFTMYTYKDTTIVKQSFVNLGATVASPTIDGGKSASADFSYIIVPTGGMRSDYWTHARIQIKNWRDRWWWAKYDSQAIEHYQAAATLRWVNGGMACADLAISQADDAALVNKLVFSTYNAGTYFAVGSKFTIRKRNA